MNLCCRWLHGAPLSVGGVAQGQQSLAWRCWTRNSASETGKTGGCGRRGRGAWRVGGWKRSQGNCSGSGLGGERGEGGGGRGCGWGWVRLRGDCLWWSPWGKGPVGDAAQGEVQDRLQGPPHHVLICLRVAGWRGWGWAGRQIRAKGWAAPAPLEAGGGLLAVSRAHWSRADVQLWGRGAAARVPHADLLRLKVRCQEQTQQLQRYGVPPVVGGGLLTKAPRTPAMADLRPCS